MDGNKTHIVGIHQPNFLPWLGYFYKMAQCDSFVFYDSAEFTKRSFIRRVKIHHALDSDKERYLIVPLKSHSDFARINELEIQYDGQNWKKKMCAVIHSVYQKAPFYNQLESIVDLIQGTDDQLSDLNIKLIKHIAKLLQLSPTFHTSTEVGYSTSGSAANLEMCFKLNASHYLSGKGAKKYQQDSDFSDNNIQLIYSDFNQLWESLPFDDALKSKSIIAYLAMHDISEIQSFLKQKTC